MNEFYNYDHVPMDESDWKLLIKNLPTLDAFECALKTAFSLGYYRGQRETIENARQILKASQDKI